jgi:spermidine synthase
MTIDEMKTLEKCDRVSRPDGVVGTVKGRTWYDDGVKVMWNGETYCDQVMFIAAERLTLVKKWDK